MGNEMLRSLVVFGYGEVVHKMCVADLTPFSLHDKHSFFYVVWKVSESKSLVFPVFSQRVISRVSGAATCPSVVHTYLCCSRVRKNHRHHCTAFFKTGCHGHVCNHCLDIIPETEFLEKVDLEASHPVTYSQLRCWGWPQFTYASCLFRGRSMVGWAGIGLEVQGDWLWFWTSLLSSQT